jgi:hypothetical protein
MDNTSVVQVPKADGRKLARLPTACPYVYLQFELRISSKGICLQRNRRRVIHLLPTYLTLTRTQYPAIVSNRGNRELFVYAAFAIPCNAQKRLTAHS